MFALILLITSLLMGIGGHVKFAQLSFIDALLNASKILKGMEPVNVMISNSAKLFSSFYAIYSGVLFFKKFQ